jgi:hypothetical protein
VWQEALVTLEDGRVLWLDEFPIGPLRDATTADLPFSFTYDAPSSAYGVWILRRAIESRVWTCRIAPRFQDRNCWKRGSRSQ